MFSLRLMIADILGYVPSKCDTVVNVHNHVMRDCLLKLNWRNVNYLCTFIFVIRTAKHNIQWR